MLLVVEEAVVLIDDLPQGLEVALRCVGELVLVDATHQSYETHEDEKTHESYKTHRTYRPHTTYTTISTHTTNT